MDTSIDRRAAIARPLVAAGLLVAATFAHAPALARSTGRPAATDATRARAADLPPARLPDLLREARDRNPSIAAADARARAAAAVPARVSALDDPTLGWEAWNFPGGVKVGQADNNIFRLSQRLPFPGKRRLAGEMAERDADVARSDATASRLDVELELKTAFVAYWQAHANAGIYAREREILERFARTAEQRYATGEVPQADVLRAQVELGHAISRVRTGELAIEQARVRINSLLSRDPSTPLGPPEAPGHPRVGWTAAELAALAFDARPELAGSDAAIGREEAGVALAEKGFWPDFEVSVSRFVNHDQPDGFGAMASVTLPFVQRRKVEAAVAEGNARIAAARADRRALEDRIRRSIEDLLLRARTDVLQHDVFLDTHIPQGEQALRVTEAAWTAGAVDLMAFLDTVRAIEQAHLEHVATQAEFETTWAEIERTVGRDLPRVRGGELDAGTAIDHARAAGLRAKRGGAASSLAGAKAGRAIPGREGLRAAANAVSSDSTSGEGARP
ncbi:MAG: TolC family protein [Alphaproteobacteria bacterium]